MTQIQKQLADLQRSRYESSLCMSCGEERHSWLFPCDPMLKARREETSEEDEKEEK